MTYEELLIEADNQNLIVREKDIPGYGGRIYKNRIAIHKGIETDAEKSCVLAEELGHYYTSYGNIIEQSDVSNRKQEYRARLKGYDLKIGLSGIVDCFECDCQSIHDMAQHLNAPEDYVRTVINCYKSKYGLCVRFEKYLIMFDPALAVIKLI